MLNVHVSVDDAIELIFVDNVNDAKLELSLDGIETTRDLFYFIVDMAFKGLVRLFGDANRRICIDSITRDQFGQVVRKLRNAGIVCDLLIEPNDGLRAPGIDALNQCIEASAPLSEYSLHMFTSSYLYTIRFHLSHT